MLVLNTRSTSHTCSKLDFSFLAQSSVRRAHRSHETGRIHGRPCQGLAPQRQTSILFSPWSFAPWARDLHRLHKFRKPAPQVHRGWLLIPRHGTWDVENVTKALLKLTTFGRGFTAIFVGSGGKVGSLRGFLGLGFKPLPGSCFERVSYHVAKLGFLRRRWKLGFC